MKAIILILLSVWCSAVPSHPHSIYTHHSSHKLLPTKWFQILIWQVWKFSLLDFIKNLFQNNPIKSILLLAKPGVLFLVVTKVRAYLVDTFAGMLAGQS